MYNNYQANQSRQPAYFDPREQRHSYDQRRPYRPPHLRLPSREPLLYDYPREPSYQQNYPQHNAQLHHQAQPSYYDGYSDYRRQRYYPIGADRGDWDGAWRDGGRYDQHYPNPAAPPFHPSTPAYSQPRREPPYERERWERDQRPSPPTRAREQPRPRTPPPPKNSPSHLASPGRPAGRRPKIARTAPGVVLTPSDAYLASTLLPVFSVVPSIQNPTLLVLDLNNCIVFRRSRSAKGSRTPIPRPYLSTFLEWVCGYEQSPLVGDDDDTIEVGRRFATVVYSSARSYNVLSMLSALGMVPPRALTHLKGTPWASRSDEALEMVFTREMMGLSPREFEQNVETVKDLDGVWKGLHGRWGLERTVLLDDEAFKASLQPYNHLPISPFFVEATDFPLSPPSSPSRSPGPPSPSLPDDKALLETIYLLSVLRTKSNVAAFIRSGGIERIREDAGGAEGLAKRGAEVCRKAGVGVAKEWDAGWWDRCVRSRRA